MRYASCDSNHGVAKVLQSIEMNSFENAAMDSSLQSRDLQTQHRHAASTKPQARRITQAAALPGTAQSNLFIE